MMVSSVPFLTSFAVLFYSLLLSFPTVTHASSSAPWQAQSSTGNNKNKNPDEDYYKKLPPIVFSGNGRLYSVERMVEAASNPEDASSNVAVAICYQGGVVMVSSATKSPHLEDDNCTVTEASIDGKANTTTAQSNATYISLLIPEQSSSTYCQVGPNVYATTGGNAADSQLLRDQILQISSMLWESRTAPTPTFLPPSLVARHVADHLQRPTQQMEHGSILASQALVWDSSSIWRVDPSGQFWKCRAAAIGRSRPKVEALLVKGLLSNSTANDNNATTVTNDRDLTQKEAIQLAVESVQSVVPKERRLFGLVVTTGGKKKPMTHEKLSSITQE